MSDCAHAYRGRDALLLSAYLAIASGCGRGSVLVFDDAGDANPGAPGAQADCDASERRFATEVIAYEPALSGFAPTHPDVLDPEDALGPPDYSSASGLPGLGAVSLGQGGRLELKLGACWLTNDSSAAADLRVYEVGPAVEGLSVALHARPETAGRMDPARRIDDDELWFQVASIGGGESDLDLDELAGGATVLFDAVRFDDDPSQGSGTELAWGADIDAVELLTWVEP